MEKTEEMPVTVLNEMRGKINSLNEASREINKRISLKLDHLRGELPKKESDVKPDQVYGSINEMNQMIDFLSNKTTATDKLLNELFELV